VELTVFLQIQRGPFESTVENTVNCRRLDKFGGSRTTAIDQIFNKLPESPVQLTIHVTSSMNYPVTLYLSYVISRQNPPQYPIPLTPTRLF